MAPEQARGLAELDARADVFALGCVLFECLTGRQAFAGEDAMALIAKILLEEPPPLRELGCDVPVELEELVARCSPRIRRRAPPTAPRWRDACRGLPPLDDKRPSLTPTAGALGGGERRLSRRRDGARRPRRRRRDRADRRRARRPLRALADGSIVVTLAGAGAATDLAAQAARCALAMRGSL